jgi:hypothetical protein
MQLSIVALAIGVSKYLQIGEAGVPTKAVVILMVAYAGIFCGLALIGWFSRRSRHGELLALRLATASVAVISGLVVLAVDVITPGQYLIVLAVLSSGHSVLAARLCRDTVLEGDHLRSDASVS